MANNATNECPLCDHLKRKASALVCADCYQVFVTEAGRALAREGEAPSVLQWVMTRAEERLPQRREELEARRTQYSALQVKVRSLAHQELLSKRKTQKAVSAEVYEAALSQIQKDIWKREGGNKLHYEMKVLEGKIAVLEGILLGREEAKVSAPEESSTSAETEIPPEIPPVE